MDRHIVPVEPASGSGEIVVIEVHQQGPHELDLRLVGCEGESPYVVNIKQSQLPKWKHKFKGTNADWETVLAYFLLRKQPDHSQATLLDGVRMVYSLNKDSLTVSVCQHVQGIKVTWGEIVLPRDDEFEFNPFEWAQASAQAHAQTLQQLRDLKARIDDEKHTITKLNAQLDDFIKTKNDAETAMLHQFMQLLNEKKRKIRDQSRLLAGAKVDKSTAIAIQSARTETPRKPGPSRTSKRRASSDSDQMDTNEAKHEDQNDDAKLEHQDDDADVPGPATPDRGSDTETESEDDVSPRGASSETLKSSSTVAQPINKPTPSTDGPPPQRALPFGRAGTRSRGPSKKPSPPPPTNHSIGNNGDDDDETDDEEL